MTATPEPAARGRGTPAGRAAGRELASVAAVCAVGGGMVLFAVGRPWVELVAHRASPLPDVTLGLSGRTLEPLVAGLGIVADSIPAAEELETRNKARAVLQALATAATLTPPPIP